MIILADHTLQHSAETLALLVGITLLFSGMVIGFRMLWRFRHRVHKMSEQIGAIFDNQAVSHEAIIDRLTMLEQRTISASQLENATKQLVPGSGNDDTLADKINHLISELDYKQHRVWWRFNRQSKRR